MARAEATQAAKDEARPRLTSFRSSGLHVLEPYISPHQPRDSDQLSTSGRAQSQGSHAQAPSRIWTGHIPADNVGFRLLRKAGWSVGAGLGAGEQGRREPIQPALPKGTRGLGFDSRTAQLQQQKQQQQQKLQQGQKRLADESTEGDEHRSRAGAANGQDRVSTLIREELARESLSDKLGLHRQLIKTQHEEQRGRAIDRYIRSAFNDPFDSLRSDNSNPLNRPHRLTGSNPLLDPIGD